MATESAPTVISIVSLIISLTGSAFVAVVTARQSAKTSVLVEKLKSQLEQARYVTKAHADVELDALRNLWSKLSALRLRGDALIAIRTLGSEFPEEDQHEFMAKCLQSALQEFIETQNLAVQFAHDWAPFYPDEIRKEVNAATWLASELAVTFLRQNEEFLSFEWFSVRALKVAEIKEHLAVVEKLIRIHLQSLRVAA